MSFAFTICLVVLCLAAALGMPIAFAMIVSAVAYLAISGQDLALSSEQLIQSVYDSFVLLAVPLRKLPGVTLRVLPMLMMPVILLAGIYGGATTPTEAAAVAALCALIVFGVFYRSISLRALCDVFVDSARSSASVGLVIGSTLIFNYIIATENIPDSLSALLVSMDLSKWQFLIFVNVLFLILGCILDASTIILVIILLFLPGVHALGIDPVHFGVFAVVNCLIGLITPPHGMLLFVINGVTGIAIKDTVKEALPFLIALGLVTAFRGLVPGLPRLMGYEG